MAKVSLTKLGLKVNQDVKNIEFNEQIVEVKQYLPVNDKLELISNVINSAHDENNFSNPIKVSVFTTLEIMYAYTNVNFTDKQKEDIRLVTEERTKVGVFRGKDTYNEKAAYFGFDFNAVTSVTAGAGCIGIYNGGSFIQSTCQSTGFTPTGMTCKCYVVHIGTAEFFQSIHTS